MYKGRSACLACFLCFSTAVHAQYSEAMRAIRPGQSIGPWITGKNILQLHTGLDMGWSETSNESKDLYYNYKARNALICYGLTSKFELNALPEFRTDRIISDNATSKRSGFSLAAIGGRYNICDGGTSLPSIGIQALLKLPVLSQDYKINYIAPRVVAMVSYSPTSAVIMLANIGFEYDGVSKDAAQIYAVNLSYQFTNKLGAFIETYGAHKRKPVYNHVDLGLYYYVTRNLQIDAFGGMGKRNDHNEAFFSTGFSYRINTAHNHKETVAAHAKTPIL